MYIPGCRVALVSLIRHTEAFDFVRTSKAETNFSLTYIQSSAILKCISF